MAKTASIEHYQDVTQHAKLFHHLWGYSAKDMRRNNIQFIASGFSYQARDYKNPTKLVCDFIFRSGTFNAGAVTDFSQYATKGEEIDGSGTERSEDMKIANLIKFAINKWRETGIRTTYIRDIYETRNPLLLDLFPMCPTNK